MPIPLHNTPSTQTKIALKFGRTSAEPALSNLSPIVWAVTTIIVAVLIVSIGWLLKNVTDVSDAKATAVVQGGSAFHTRAEDGAIQQVSDGAALLLNVGDTITATTASIQITYFEGQTTELLPGASITIQQLENRNGRTVVEILVNIGRVFNRVKRSLRDGEMFKVNTPSSAAAVRGTEFIVETQSASTSYYATIEGIVRVTLGDQSIDLRAGQEVLAIQGQPLIIGSQTQTPTESELLTAAAPSFRSNSRVDTANSNLSSAGSDVFADGSTGVEAQELSASQEFGAANSLEIDARSQEQSPGASSPVVHQANKTGVEQTGQAFAAGLNDQAAQQGATTEQQLAALQTSVAQQIIVAQQTAFAQKTALVQALNTPVTPTPLGSEDLSMTEDISTPLSTSTLLTTNRSTTQDTPHPPIPTQTLSIPTPSATAARDSVATALPVAASPTYKPTSILSTQTPVGTEAGGAVATETRMPTPTYTIEPAYVIEPTATPHPTQNDSQPSRPTKTPTPSIPTATHTSTHAPTSTWTPQATATIEPTFTPVATFTATIPPTVDTSAPAVTPTRTPAPTNTPQPTVDATSQTAILPAPTSNLPIEENPDAISTLAAEPTIPPAVTPIPTVGLVPTDTPMPPPAPVLTTTWTPQPTATSVETPTNVPIVVTPTASSDIIPTDVVDTPTPPATNTSVAATSTATADPATPKPKPTHPVHPTHPPTPEQRATPKP